MTTRITRAWNARTPAYLHPYTKENLIWQLKLLAVFLLGSAVIGWLREQPLSRTSFDNLKMPNRFK